MSTYLRFLGKQAQLLVPGHGVLWDTLQGLGKSDLVVGISFPRYTTLTLEVLEHARKKRARVGAITDTPLSPLARHAHWVLTAHCQLDSFIEAVRTRNVRAGAAHEGLSALRTALRVIDAMQPLDDLQ